MLTVRPAGAPFVLLFSRLTHLPPVEAAVGSVAARACAAEPRGLFVTSEICMAAMSTHDTRKQRHSNLEEEHKLHTDLCARVAYKETVAHLSEVYSTTRIEVDLWIDF